MKTKPPLGPATRLCMSLSGRPGRSGTIFHNRLYELLGLDYIYKSFGTTDLAAAVAGIRGLGIRGCAISMPFKEDVIALIDRVEPSVRAIDSVNTIVNDDGVLIGHNTDFVAVRDIVAAAGIAPTTPFVLRGSGGMAKAVTAALRDLGFGTGTIVARNGETGPALAEKYGYGWRADPGEPGAAMLINVTPLGMEGVDADALAFPPAHVEAAHVAFDVVAQPVETPFIKMSRAQGKRVLTGASVIVLQAVRQFVLYTGHTPTPAMIEEAAALAHGQEAAAEIAAVLAA
ncbi:shikimate 5-dehydrogenase [uncultured Croceicoccus sp.]|uniref:shikimate 5-dehydrogenase n=1 Tax=uncultured Croceicoccus sp. TaxID=1295329 RepID=UPI0026081B2A|nr:shikimate 5-dehydrogenase [uncultured Croceicoccus sp.]